MPEAPKAKLFIVAQADKDLFPELQRRLALDFSRIDVLTAVFGSSGNLVQLFATELPLFIEELPSVQSHLVRLEKVYAGEAAAVRLSAGYIVGPKVVLSSTDDAPHRIYVGHGVFQEPVLTLGDPEFAYFPWSPEYVKSNEAENFFRHFWMIAAPARPAAP